MKNDIVANLRLELERERTRVRTSVRCGDTKTITYHFTLLQSGKIYDLADALMATIYITKPDENVCYNDCVIDGNEIYYTLKTQDINVSGEDKCYLEVTNKDGSIITSPEFIIYVYENGKNMDLLKSENEYGALTEWVVKANDYAQSAKNSADQAEIAETNATESATKAETSESNAKEYSDIATSAVETAETKAAEASQSENNAKSSKEAAQKYAEASESNAAETAKDLQDVKTAQESVNKVLLYVTESEGKVQEYYVLVKEYASTASGAAGEAEKSQETAQHYAQEAQKVYENIVNAGILALGETHSTAFYGDWGKQAYAHSNVVHGNPHNVSYSEVGADKEGTAQEYYENATAYTDLKIANLINGAPETLDTLKEIADAMAENKTVVEALDEAVGKKANQAELETHQNNGTIHITATERTKWNGYGERIATLETIVKALGYPYTQEQEE